MIGLYIINVYLIIIINDYEDRRIIMIMNMGNGKGLRR